MRFRLAAATFLLISSLLSRVAAPVTPPRIPRLEDNPKVAYVVGEITRDTEWSFEKQVWETEGLPGDRLIVINSPGGEVGAGNEIISLIELEKAKGTHVTCLVLHQASSMAFNILTHCDTRLATPKAYMVVHKVAFYGFPEGERMTAVRLRELADDLDRSDASFRRDNARAMHLRLKDYDLFADKETAWAASTLLKMHYLSGIVPE